MGGGYSMTTDSLIRDGYKIINMQITYVDLSMSDYGCMVLSMAMEGSGYSVVYGNHCLGHGYLGAKEFDGNEKSMPYIMNIMNVVGVERFNDMKGKYARIAFKGLGSSTKIIGNIIEDKWFDPESFFNN